MPIHENLRAVRVLRGFKQETVALQLGISQNTYSRIERGKIKLSPEKKSLLCGIFQISENQLDAFSASRTNISDSLLSHNKSEKTNTPISDNIGRGENHNTMSVISTLQQEINLLKELVLNHQAALLSEIRAFRQ